MRKRLPQPDVLLVERRKNVDYLLNDDHADGATRAVWMRRFGFDVGHWMETPLREIVNNAGEEASVILNQVADGKGNHGYNAANGQFGDMVEMGILDPTKVTRTALQNAASIAGLMITTEGRRHLAPSSKAYPGRDGAHRSLNSVAPPPATEKTERLRHHAEGCCEQSMPGLVITIATHPLFALLQYSPIANGFQTELCQEVLCTKHSQLRRCQRIGDHAHSPISAGGSLCFGELVGGYVGVGRAPRSAFHFQQQFFLARHRLKVIAHVVLLPISHCVSATLEVLPDKIDGGFFDVADVFVRGEADMARNADILGFDFLT
jgi:hypothetical protein